MFTCRSGLSFRRKKLGPCGVVETGSEARGVVLGKRSFGIKNVHGGLYDWETDEAKLAQAHQVSQKTVDVVFLQDIRAFFFCKLDTRSGNMLVSYHPGI